MAVRFYLKHTSKIGERPINLVFRHNGLMFKYATGESIHPKYWDEEKQRVRKNYPGSPELNARLREFENKLLTLYSNAKINGGIPSPDILRVKMNETLKGVPKKKHSFFSVFENYIEQTKAVKKNTTIKKFKTCLYI